MTNPVAGESQIRVARIERVRKVLVVKICHDLLSSAVEERAQNPAILQGTHRRNARQSSPRTATEQAKEHGFCLVVGSMCKHYCMKCEGRTGRLKKSIPFCPCPGFDARAFFWGSEDFNHTGKLPPCSQRFNETLFVVCFGTEAVIDVEDSKCEAVFIRKGNKRSEERDRIRATRDRDTNSKLLCCG
jgi:hypothetical protein